MDPDSDTNAFELDSGPDHDHDHDHDHHHHDHTSSHDHDTAEAVLASLRAVINDPSPHTQHHHASQLQQSHTLASESDSDLINGQEQHAHHHEQDQPELHGETLNTLSAEGEVDPNAESELDHEHGHDQGQNESGVPTKSFYNPLANAIEKSLASLTQQVNANQGILDDLNSPGAIQNLAQNLKALGQGHKKQLDTIKELTAQVKASEMGSSLVGAYSGPLDPALSPVVLREEYESLKSKYESLLASAPTPAGTKRGAGGSSRKSRGFRADGPPGVFEPKLRALDPSLQQGETEGRKKRSIKLEHLIHKMANRRLGVEYTVSNFESKGSKDLPDPTSEAVKAADSPNGVDEFRPDFRGDVNATNVKPFIDTVVEDVVSAWEGGLSLDEPDVDRDRIVTGVNIYWTRLCKRYDEQQHRQRGEIHRDELSRRKQNTYRRQQSLLARRLAAFDSSPLGACKLRALYRTLLTIDFAAPTQDAPDPKRVYTEEEWYAYRKVACGARASEAHEVIDQFWLSPNVRSILTILDTYSVDMTARSRKKGRPKQPNPTFHLPASLWDRSTLPTLRPSDNSGLPISGAQGLVLFKFHVDEAVQLENPEWAKGLYDNPPIPEEDNDLAGLPEVMNMAIYASLRPAIKEAREKANPPILTPEQIKELQANVDTPLISNAIEVDQTILDPASLGAGMSIDPDLVGEAGQTVAGSQSDTDYLTFAAFSQLTEAGVDTDSHVNAGASGHAGTAEIAGAASSSGNKSSTTMHPNTHHQPEHSHNHTPLLTTAQILALPYMSSNPLSGLSGVTEHTVGPSPGSSLRARKLGKRMASEVPGGAATPVPKRKRERESASLSLGGVGVDSGDSDILAQVGIGAGSGSGIGVGVGDLETSNGERNVGGAGGEDGDEEGGHEVEEEGLNLDLEGDASFFQDL